MYTPLTVALRLLGYRHSAQCDHLGYTHPHYTTRNGAFIRLYQSSDDAEQLRTRSRPVEVRTLSEYDEQVARPVVGY